MLHTDETTGLRRRRPDLSARPLHRNPSPCCTSAATGADDIDARGVLPLLTGVPVRDGYNHLIDTAHA
jgi:hypothetical protein